MSSQISLLAAALRTSLAAAGLAFVLGPLLLPQHLDAPALSLAGLGLLIGLVLHAGLQPGLCENGHGQHRSESDDDRLRCRKAETASRHLLDLQSDSILELDAERHLAFVNRAFCDVTVECGPGQAPAFTLALPLPLDAATATPSPKEHHVPPVRTLICSSLKIEAKALAAELSLAGARVTVIDCDQMESAISQTVNASEAFDLVLVDGAIGPDLAAVLLACAKEQSTGRRVRGCVLVTGRQVEQLDAFRIAGMQEYLVRPVRRSSLRALLGSCNRSEDEHPTTPRRIGNPADGPAPGCHVLIAEDDPINARLAQCMAHRAGCTTTLVETGRAAVDAVRSSLEGRGPAIDLVLMDLHMPDLDGIAAARTLRVVSDRSQGQAATGRSCPPLIAMTANAFSEARRSCLAAGLDDYLAKPFTWAEFQAVLSRWLPGSRHPSTSSDPRHHAA